MRIFLLPFFYLISCFLSNTRYEDAFSAFICDYYRDFDLFNPF